MEISKRPPVWALFVINLAYGAAYVGSLLAPVTTRMFEEFAAYPDFWKNYIISGPALWVAVFSIVTGVAARYVSKRKLYLTGAICYVVSGLGLVLARSLPAYVVLRTIGGISAGITGVTVPGMLCELYSDPRERSRYLSYFTLTGAGMGMAFSLLGGAIATWGDWRNVFWINIISIPAVIAAFFFFPDTGAEGEKAAQASEGQKRPFNRPLFVTVVLGQFVMCTLYRVIYYLADLYVSQTGIGGSALTGTESSAGQLMAALCAMSFAAAYGKLRRWTSPVTWCVVGLAFVCLGFHANAVLFVLLGAVAAGAQSINYIYYQQKLSELAPAGKTTLFMMLNSVLIALASYLSPFLPTVFKALTGTADMQETFFVMGTVILVCAAAAVVFVFLIRDVQPVKSQKNGTL